MFLLLTALATWLPADPLRVDLPRFPDGQETVCNVSLATSYLESVRNGGHWEPTLESHCTFLREGRRHREPWLALCAAHDQNRAAAERRESLAELRELIGPEAYARGWLPPPVPWHLMPER